MDKPSDAKAQLIDNEEQVLIPSTVLAMARNLIDFTKTAKLVSIRGKYFRGSNQKYGAYYYDRLQDEGGSGRVTLKVNEFTRSRLSNGQVVMLIGALDVQMRQGEPHIEIAVVVQDVDKSVKPTVTAEDADTTKLVLAKKSRVQQPEAPLARLIQQSARPRVAVITGANSRVLSDVIRALDPHQGYFEFIPWEVSVTSDNQVAHCLNQLRGKNFNLIVLIRGGGSAADLEKLDTTTVFKAILQLDAPFVVAMGHENDNPRIQLMADRHFATPTALGEWLRGIVEGRLIFLDNQSLKKDIDELRKAAAKELKDINEKLRIAEKAAGELGGLKAAMAEKEKRYVALAKSLAESKKLRNIGWVVTAILIVVLVFVLKNHQ